MRYALTFLLMATIALGQGVWPKTATVVDGGHRYDFDTLGKRSVTPSADYGNIVLWQAFSYSDNSDADFYDLSTDGNDGAQTTAAAQPTHSTADGGVYDFDGVDDNIDCGSVATAISGQLTVAAWIRTDQATATVVVFDGRNDSGSNAGFLMDMQTGDNIRLIIDTDAAAGANSTGASTLSTNTWYHVAGTRDGSGVIDVYVNGSQDDATPTTLAGTMTITDDSAIGVNTASGAGFYDGDLDDVRIYSTALTAAEVLAIYNNTKGTYGL
tara:strand:- start:403 stop:1209 length:807 start_codon:yes stop_codon:yes gene_type:complete